MTEGPLVLPWRGWRSLGRDDELAARNAAVSTGGWKGWRSKLAATNGGRVGWRSRMASS